MNKVIIFGGDHYNALGLARMFGVNGIKPYGILIITKEHEKEVYACKSRYWEECWLVYSEEEGLKKILELFVHEAEMPVIIPSSDGAEVIIDNNYNILKDYFFLPSINDTQGEISKLMNKVNQIKWARSIGLKTVESWDLSLLENNCIDKIKIYPCILKPVISSEGEKTDIVKCNDLEEALHAIDVLKRKGYKKILAQEFIKKDYEMELFGCITKYSKLTPYLLSKHIREWPPIAGSVSCHEFIIEKEYKDVAESILKKIMDYGYNGNIDIELFMVKGEIYLNEVNFRNSGDVYACFYNKLYYSLIWYLDIIGRDVSNMNMTYDNTKYAMNETTDFRHVVYGTLKLKQWLKYYKNCADFAIKFKGDTRPVRARYLYYIKKALFSSKNQKNLVKKEAIRS